MNQKITTSPWGAVQDQDNIAEGIAFVSTASHGGYWFSAANWQRITRMFPTYEARYAPPGWLEEDCDCVLAPLAFPEHFNDQAIFAAVRMVRNSPDFGASAAAAPFLDSGSMVSTHCLERARKHEQAIAKLWERGSMSTANLERDGARGWWVYFSRGNETRTAILPDYPSKVYYSDEELAGLPTGEKEAA